MTPETLDRYFSGTSQGASALRTMRSTEVLDEALRIYRTLAPVLLRRSAVPAVFVLSAVLFWTTAFLPRLATTNHPGNLSAQVGEAWVALTIAVVIGGPLLLFGVSEATLQAVAVVTPYREGKKINVDHAATKVRAAYGRTLGAAIWTFLIAGAVPLMSFGSMAIGGLMAQTTDESSSIAGVFALFGVLGMLGGGMVALWAIGAHALAPALTLRGEGPIAACRASRKLMAGAGRMPGGYGTVWAVYAILMFAGLAEIVGLELIRSLIGLGDALPGGALFSRFIELVEPFVVAWTLLPFWGVAVAVMDGERRVRVEGYDVELLAKG